VTAWLIGAYPWIKAAHIVAIVAWMAGLLYLPRLFVYHAGVPAGSETARIFIVMERRLLRGIMNPALALTIGLGAALTATPGVVDWRQGWIWAKIALAGSLVVFHCLLARWRREFAAGAVPHDSRFFRLINEIPTVVLIGIVILVVVKPF
jgi:protoporphyrinogen IX oxidase